MLGIDLSDNKIHIVKLKRKRSRFAVAGAFCIDYDANTAEEIIPTIGDKLLKVLAHNGWLKNEAVIAVPHRPCFVKRFELSLPENPNHLNSKPILDSIISQASESLLGNSEEVIFDIWQPETDLKKCSHVVAASVQKKQISLAKALADYCNLRLQSIEVRSVATINSFSQFRKDSSKKNIAIIYKSETRIFLGIYDSLGLVSVQSFPSNNGQCVQEDTNNIIRIFNTRKLKQGSQDMPSLILLASSSPQNQYSEEWLNDAQKELYAGLGIQTEIIPEDMGYFWLDNIADNKTAYAPAIGAALNGLKHNAESFDFLHIKDRKSSENNKKNNITTLLVVLALLLVLATTLWFSLVRQAHSTIANLEAEIARAEPEKDAVFQAQSLWVQCMPYTPIAKGGNRLEYLNILHELTTLMPETNKAYITNLSVFSDRTSNGYNVKATIKATEATLITGITERMNKSAIFQEVKQDGARTHDETDEYYPISFSITFNLIRPINTIPALKESVAR